MPESWQTSAVGPAHNPKEELLMIMELSLEAKADGDNVTVVFDRERVLGYLNTYFYTKEEVKMKFKEFAERVKSLGIQVNEASKESLDFTVSRFKSVSWNPKTPVKKAKNVVAAALLWAATKMRS